MCSVCWFPYLTTFLNVQPMFRPIFFQRYFLSASGTLTLMLDLLSTSPQVSAALPVSFPSIVQAGDSSSSFLVTERGNCKILGKERLEDALWIALKIQDGAKKCRWLLETGKKKEVKEQILLKIQKEGVSDDIFILAPQLQSCKVIRSCCILSH